MCAAMSPDWPGPPGETLNFGQTTEPRPAGHGDPSAGWGGDASRCCWSAATRARASWAAPGCFPGGAVDRHEGSGDAAHRAAAIRELEEEAAIRIDDPGRLVPFSRWITPAEVKIRFDTWFYLMAAPAGVQAQPDGSEVVDARWYAPGAALEARSRGELFLVFPTIKHLEQLSSFASADELLAHARGREISPVQPRVLLQGETARIVLPGEPGYAD